MTSTVEPTPAQELFRELSELGNLLYCALAVPKATVHHWPNYYLVYVQFEHLCVEVSRAIGCLGRGFDGAAGTVDQVAVEVANAGFARLDRHYRTVVDLLVHMTRHRQVDCGVDDLARIITRHFSPDSRWNLATNEHYCSGFVSRDAAFLQRACVLLDPLAKSTSTVVRECMVTFQTFGLESAEARSLLVRTARQVQTRLNQANAALGAFFVANCPSLADMLHPSKK